MFFCFTTDLKQSYGNMKLIRQINNNLYKVHASQQCSNILICTLLYDKVLLRQDRGFQFHECTRSANNNKTVGYLQT